ncbi:MAG: exodeoxyribonuclease VII large subunit, partial [Gammaproteobacteria bacterium]|nr:exodeoxyribonuclease VII large subunit [Gammaproteobacteria bacterium]
RLAAANPASQLRRQAQRRHDLERRLYRSAMQQLERKDQALAGLARELNAISPLATLGRGYALVFDAGGHLLREPSGLAAGDAIRAQVSGGQIHARVTSVEKT